MATYPNQKLLDCNGIKVGLTIPVPWVVLEDRPGSPESSSNLIPIADTAECLSFGKYWNVDWGGARSTCEGYIWYIVDMVYYQVLYLYMSSYMHTYVYIYIYTYVYIYIYCKCTYSDMQLHISWPNSKHVAPVWVGIHCMSLLHLFLLPYAVLPEESMTFGNLTARVAQAARRWVWPKNSGWFFCTIINIYIYIYIHIYIYIIFIIIPSLKPTANAPNNGWNREYFLPFLLGRRNLAGDMLSCREGIWFSWRY